MIYPFLLKAQEILFHLKYEQKQGLQLNSMQIIKRKKNKEPNTVSIGSVNPPEKHTHNKL